MDKSLLKRLQIPGDRLDAINHVLLDENSQVMSDFLAVVAKYGSPEEINKKHLASRNLDVLLKKVRAKNQGYVEDLKWLLGQREKGGFISVKDYRRNILGAEADKIDFHEDFAVTLETSALQYQAGSSQSGE